MCHTTRSCELRGLLLTALMPCVMNAYIERKRKWTDSGSKQLENLNKDYNKSGGLLAKLFLAEGIRVTFHRNFDTNTGLVKGSSALYEH